ncbi:MAG: hypothetical protein GC191_13680 [Azospirillum sp.]|nr:hypothetical protein [Azospirillum sp.]
MTLWRRRTLLQTAAGALTGGTLAGGTGFAGRAAAAETEQVAAAHRFRIWMVTFRGWTATDQGFKSYLERRRIPVELVHRDVDGKRERLAEIVAEIRAQRPDLVYSWGTTVTLGLLGRHDDADRSAYLNEVPVIFLNVTDPVASRIVPNLAPTGRNIAGSTFVAPVSAQLQAMRGYRPVTRIAAIFNPKESNAVGMVRDMAALAETQGVTLVSHPVPVEEGATRPASASIAEVVEGIKADRAEFVYVPPDSFLSSHSDDLVAAAIPFKLPIFAAAEGAFDAAGTLMGLFARYFNIGQLGGYQAERILLEGAAPGTMAIESLQRYSLVISMNTARKLDLYPPVLLCRNAEFA